MLGCLVIIKSVTNAPANHCKITYVFCKFIGLGPEHCNTFRLKIQLSLCVYGTGCFPISIKLAKKPQLARTHGSYSISIMKPNKLIGYSGRAKLNANKNFFDIDWMWRKNELNLSLVVVAILNAKERKLGRAVSFSSRFCRHFDGRIQLYSDRRLIGSRIT